jgi:hypothetical protein
VIHQWKQFRKSEITKREIIRTKRGQDVGCADFSQNDPPMETILKLGYYKRTKE